jgi:hypothetical protein
MKIGYEPKEESEAASVSQFALWYFFAAVIAYLLFGLSFIGIINIILNLACIVLLHYAGLEDVLFYTVAMIPYFALPREYWTDRICQWIFGVRFPSYLPWLARTRKVLWMTIKSYWIPFFSISNVRLGGLLVSVAVAVAIVIAAGLLI